MTPENFRPRSIEEIYFKQPTILEIIKPSEPISNTLAEGGVIISAPVTPIPPPDISNPILDNPSVFNSLGSFIYRNQLTLIIIAIGAGFITYGYYKKRKNEKEKKVSNNNIIS